MNKQDACKLQFRWVANYLCHEPDETIDQEIKALSDRWYAGEELQVAERLALAEAQKYTTIRNYSVDTYADVHREMSIDAKFHVLAGAVLETANINTPQNHRRKAELIRYYEIERAEMAQMDAEDLHFIAYQS